MGKRQLNPKIMEVLKRKTGKNETSISPDLSDIRNKYNLTLNAAAFMYAKNRRFSVGRYLTDEDRESLKAIKIEREIVKIKLQSKIKSKLIIFIKYETDDKLLAKHIEEINKTYTHGCYT